MGGGDICPSLRGMVKARRHDLLAAQTLQPDPGHTPRPAIANRQRERGQAIRTSQEPMGSEDIHFDNPNIRAKARPLEHKTPSTLPNMMEPT